MGRASLLLMLAFAACESAPVRGEPRLEMFNVQDLVSCDVSFGSCTIPDDPEGCRPFERKARQAVRAPWDDATGWTLVFQNGLLIVRADDSALRAVREFLASERAA
jgi:hypothetical protein